ncbi:hypothetical protein ATCC90586_006537 [Pythium insidiosum]|nr:hypothetical protein ATCC90586_006537 [Pythium insidiosum]
MATPASASETALLTAEMRAVTRKSHDISNNLVNLKLVVALTNKELYGRALLLFYYVFAQMETSLRECKNNDALRGLHEILPDFQRADAFAKDLAFYLGDDWSTKHNPTSAAANYVKRIKEVEKQNPELLLAYFYHMYTALLAGGQMVRKMVKRSFDLKETTGLEVFEFTKNRLAIRTTIKDRIDSVAIDETKRKLIMDESLRIFDMNNQEGDHAPFRDDYGAPPMDFRGPPPGPAGPGFAPPPPHPYGGGDPGFPPHHRPFPPHPRSPPAPAYDGDFRGRRRSDSRGGDYGYPPDRRGYGGGGGGRWRGRSRSRSPPGRGYGGGHSHGHGHGHGPGPRSDWGQGPAGDHNPHSAGAAAPAPTAAGKQVQAMEPMDSYKVFMMRQDENSTPETYQQRYEEYKKKYTQRLMRAFFEDHKREDWLQERYSPAIRFRVDQQKKAARVGEAKQFMERLVSGTSKINLDEENDLEGKDYDNDLEDSKRILYVRRIPCACPVTTLSEAIKKAGGNFQEIHLSDPVKKSAFDFDRSAYIIYETPEAAEEALPKIHNTFVQDADLFPPFRLQVSQHRSRAPLKTPSNMSLPERIAFDFKQALTLASRLDKTLYSKEQDLNACGIEALLEHQDVVAAYPTEKSKLDVIVAYLRRVHHFIYYAGVQCIDMGDIMHAHPALFARPAATPKDIEDEKARKESLGAPEDATEVKASTGGWAAALDEKVQAYIEDLDADKVQEQMDKQKALVEEVESREEAALESTYTNYAEKAGDDGKHRCRLCTKLFKALDFVKKHIRNKHPELAVDKIAEVGESYMWEQYREDTNRPLPPVETTNTLTNPTLGSRGNGNSDSPFHGRGRGPYSGPPGNRGSFRDGPGYQRGYGGPPRDRPRRGSFDGRGRSPPRSQGRPPEGGLPVDPRQVSKSYQDLDNLQDTKVELSFDALDSLPPPKKKTKV